MLQTASALPIDQTIRVTRKRDARFLLTIKDAAGVVQNIEGDVFALVVCDEFGGTQKLTATCTITDAAAGTVAVVFAKADLDDGKTGDQTTRWVYTLDRTHAGETFPLFQGALEICPVTK